jgi:hypothetical protein
MESSIQFSTADYIRDLGGGLPLAQPVVETGTFIENSGVVVSSANMTFNEQTVNVASLLTADNISSGFSQRAT